MGVSTAECDDWDAARSRIGAGAEKYVEEIETKEECTVWS